MRKTKLTPASNLLWESSRIILPEHREAYLEHRRKVMEANKPKPKEPVEVQFDDLDRDWTE
jgi:hypothetical protein